MSTLASINDVHSLLGTLNLDCAVCHNPIAREDFEKGKVIALTGPKKPTAAHVHHFYTEDGESQTPDYDRNMRLLAYAYCCQNDFPMKAEK